MRKPETNSLLDWTVAAVEDMADSLDRLNHDLDKRNTDPNWSRKVWNDSWDIVSLKRWAFLLPGGGALRGGRQPGTIRPATRPTVTVQVENPSAVPVMVTPVVPVLVSSTPPAPVASAPAPVVPASPTPPAPVVTATPVSSLPVAPTPEKPKGRKFFK